MNKSNPLVFLPIGVAIGAGMGVALGNIAIGVGLGTAVGMIMIGVASKKKKSEE